MKTQISKSKVMTRAWNIFRGNNPFSYSFSAALRRAWEVEKATIIYEAKKTEEVERAEFRKNNPVKESIDWYNAYNPAISNHYSNAPRGAYFGD